MTVYLGIDYGTVHIGVALAEHILATPLPTVSNNEHLIKDLMSIIESNQVTSIVVGLPSGRIEEEVKIFASKLREISGLPVILHDETLSSHDATRQLAVIGVSRNKKTNIATPPP
jgi:putative Holliday junction resolvase